MFYSHSILAKSGPFAHVWLAATWEKKVTRSMVFGTDIATVVASIAQPNQPLALRLSANLLVGVVRIYARKVAYLMADATEAMVKIRMAFRGGVVDLPAEGAVAARAAITVANFDELDLGFELDDGAGRPSEPSGAATATDEWAAAAATTHRIGDVRDISLADDDGDDFGSRSRAPSVASGSAAGAARRRAGGASDVSSIELMRGADDESNPFDAGRDSGRGDDFMDLEPVGPADLAAAGAVDVDDDDAGAGFAAPAFDDDDDGFGGFNEEYDDACRKHLEDLAADVASYAELAKIADRVAAWQDKLEPLLESQEKDRAPFDILALGRDVVQALRSRGEAAPGAVSFLDIARHRPRYGVCRAFLATLQLANNGNLELGHATDADVLAPASAFTVSLLTEDSAHAALHSGKFEKAARRKSVLGDNGADDRRQSAFTAVRPRQSVVS
mmetsp:Transcript_18197/g.53833  ORF Transcript_18197/g.53833 Transcript_18197/m.53833 type:complete len:445 (-) Transcript_18197:44-1378(-)